jgi:hypothetical protein
VSSGNVILGLLQIGDRCHEGVVGGWVSTLTTTLWESKLKYFISEFTKTYWIWTALAEKVADCRQHVDMSPLMSPRQPNVSSFFPNAPVAATQFWSQHIFLCQDLPTSTKFSSLVPEVHTESFSVSSDMFMVGVW